MSFRRQPKRPPAAETPLLPGLLTAPVRQRLAVCRAIRRRTPPPSPGADEVRKHLEQCWLLDAGFLEGVASKAHEQTHLVDPFDAHSGDVLAARLRYLVIRSHDSVCGGGSLIERTILVRPSADDARWNLRVLHELAHALLTAEKKRFAESDAWALTLALAVPQGALKRLHEARHVPRWALALRRSTAKAE